MQPRGITAAGAHSCLPQVLLCLTVELLRCWHRTQLPCALLAALRSEQQWLQASVKLLGAWKLAHGFNRLTMDAGQQP
jgi:hypothetical protein